MTQLQRLSIAPFQFQAQQIMLNDEQQHYLFRVLRLRSGDRFIAMDGQGHWWLAELETQLSSARILEPIDACTELPMDVTLMVALPKGNGFDEVVRQATELGVACLAPVLSHRTLLKPSPQKLDRWRRIVSEAAEQSERQVVPTVLEPIDYTIGLSFVKSQSSFSQNQLYICEARGDFPHLMDCLQDAEQSTCAIATGPEGGWTSAELDEAIAAGFQPVSLGRRILRAVTAPLVALAIVAAAKRF